MTLRFPRPLRPGDRVGVTAPSTGVDDRGRGRIDFAVSWLRARGYDVVVGECLSGDRWVSAPKAERAAELTAMLTDPAIRAVVPPWGGAGTALDLLDQIDFDAVASADPTWVVGYSDTCAVLVPLTLLAGLPTLHGDNLADTPYAVPEGLVHWTDLASSAGRVTQCGSGLIADWSPLSDASATRWPVVGEGRWRLHGAQTLDVTGTLIGGCVEVLAGISGSPYADARAFGREHGPTIVYLEVAEAEAFDVCRHLHHLRYTGWFEHAVAVLVGRTAAPASAEAGGMTQDEAVLDALGGLGAPIVLDLEIGHVPPHLPLLNGARARVVVDEERHEIDQCWTPGPG